MKYLLSILFASAALAGSAANGYIVDVEQGVSVGVNPTGTSIFGYYGRTGDESQYTWIYDVESKVSADYPTNGTYLDVEGQLMWMASNLDGVGTYRDENWATTVNDGLGGSIDDYPLNTACIWKNGTRIALDHNKWEDPSTFIGRDGTLPNGGNGFYAMHITEDESLIVGYLKAFTYMLPVRWDLNADGTYTSTMMHRQEGQFFYTWVGASADCKRVILNNSQSGGQSYIWDGDDEPWIFSYSESGATIEEPHLTALSPNGKLAILSCMRNGLQAYGVYEFDTKDVRWIPIPEGAASSNWFAANVVSDRGDGYIVDYNYRLHYFNLDLGINIPFDSYIKAYGSDISYKPASLPTKAIVRMISDDGRSIAGNNLMYGLEYTGWIARLPEKQPMLFALRDCQAMYSTPQTALVKWIDPVLPEGSSISHYVITLDGYDNIITDAAKGDDAYTRAQLPCGPGDHSLTLKAIVTDDSGKQWESVRQDLTLSISDKTDLFFYEDLCDSGIDNVNLVYTYSHDTFKTAPSHDSAVLNFRLDAGDFYNLTPFWYTCGFSNAQWHTYLESRWFDATAQTEGFYFTWHERNMPINDAEDVDADNLLLVEYTVDGENWLTLNESNGEQNGSNWNVRVVDLSDLAGKYFRLRFHAQGGGYEACEWRVDNYGILPNSAMYDAPADLMVTDITPMVVRLAWKNNRGEYEVSHNYNSPMTFNNNIGNGGEPFYVACDYGPRKLQAFNGKYITGVTTLIYEPERVGQTYHTKVQAVVFDMDGNELSRGTLPEDVPWYEAGVSTSMPIHHIALDTPVLIEADKTYRVSILITDYETEMCPIWYYSASDDYITGVTDLYSDDNLKSWKTIYDLYNGTDDFDLYGRCIFNVCPTITDTPNVSDTPYCQDQWYYQVYRDGEILSSGIAYYTQQSVTDYNKGNGTYTVRSFRRDGSVSAMSEPLVFDRSGIEDASIDAANGINLVFQGSTLFINGDFDSVSVYNSLGIKIAASRVIDTSRLPKGIYLIAAKKGNQQTSLKVAL